MRRWLIVIIFLLSSVLSAETTKLMSLRGHLSKESLSTAKERLASWKVSEGSLLALEVNSSSGNLKAVLDFAKSIYQLKVNKKLRVVLYIEDSALGPSAILPFVADELYTSSFISWGDILLESETSLPTNVLRSQLKGLMGGAKSNDALWRLLAEAMVDASLRIVDDNGWKVETQENLGSRTISNTGERLVVDHNQLRTLGLAKDKVSLQVFRRAFGQEEKIEPEPLVEVKKSVETELQKRIPLKSESDKIGLIRIDDSRNGITQATWIYVKAALDYYKEVKPRFIILELNTPGGEVFSSQRISDALKEMDTQYGIPVVAFINNWAISAGAMLAYSCRFITVVKDASMGAAEPVLQGEGGQMVSASEKINSALRADFGNRARFFDRNPLIAEAMVDKDYVLVLRRGKVVKLGSDDEIKREGISPDRVITTKGKLLTLSAEAMMDLGVADIALEPKRLIPISEEEKQAGKWPFSKSLISTYPHFSGMEDSVVDSFEMDWRTHFFAFLALPAVASLLFLGMMLGFYLEINTPGFGIPGMVAITCLFFIILSSFSTDAASFLELIMVLVGLVLLGVEIFVLPGFGIAGILGLVFMLGGLVLMMLPEIGSITYEVDDNTLNAAGEEFMLRLIWLSGTFLLGLFLIALMARYLVPNLTVFQRLVSVGEQTADTGFVAGAQLKDLPKEGAIGETLSSLRPSGKILMDGNIFDASTSGTFLDRGVKIQIVEIRGSHIIVEDV